MRPQKVSVSITFDHPASSLVRVDGDYIIEGIQYCSTFVFTEKDWKEGRNEALGRVFHYADSLCEKLQQARPR